MTPENADQLLEQSYAALLRMRVEEIEASEASLRASSFVSNSLPSNDLTSKLKQLRAAAAQAVQLWQACLPQTAHVYRCDGSVAKAPARAELSVSG